MHFGTKTTIGSHRIRIVGILWATQIVVLIWLVATLSAMRGTTGLIVLGIDCGLTGLWVTTQTDLMLVVILVVLTGVAAGITASYCNTKVDWAVVAGVGWFVVLIVAAGMGKRRQRELADMVTQHEEALWRSRALAVDVLHREGVREVLEKQAYSDPLTGLANRAGMEAVVRLIEKDGTYSCMVIDLDHFKEINDTFGHDVGDAMLKMVVAALRSGVRHGDVLARTGGDEFVAILPDTPVGNAEEVARRMLNELARGSALAGTEASISIGLAGAEPGETFAAVLKRADQAMYEAKRSGGNRWVVAGPVAGLCGSTDGDNPS
jgi:diguanylate cyclase (GGDEF)-like protein